MEEVQQYQGVKAVALFAIVRAISALLVCYGLYHLADENIPQLISNLAGNFQIDSNNHHLNKVLDKASMVTPDNIKLVMVVVFLYAMVRFVEAYGLWNRYQWTEWFSFLNGCIYIPFEIYECIVAPSIISFSVLAINLTIVGYLYMVIRARRKRKLTMSNCLAQS